MNDRKHSDLQAKTRAIIDDAIAELYLMGMESADDAACLMAIQAIIRIEGDEKRKSVIEFANSLRGDG
ncbi:hypothetical protein [Qipengyuania nanhaisediminis]|uniref:Uncharacterized protein n=1 Tax=Qipengyuania nanhaisediminis TaxID=604088 RepID=A0A1I5LAF4_9SPHN|nr:hypothetical protein [Qipengyuania nanhaisediminis]SFO94205.1 hypothetical protein SAMN04488060_0863 [Qipengyuania nanhaisediminis]